MRQGTLKYPPIRKAAEAASRPYHGPAPRQRKEYQCACCLQWFPRKEVEVDHIIPCGSLTSYEDLPCYVALLFCEQDNLQVLCKPCHHDKHNRPPLHKRNKTRIIRAGGDKYTNSRQRKALKRKKEEK